MHKSLAFFLALVGITGCNFSLDGSVGKDSTDPYWNDTGTPDSGSTTDSACDTADTANTVTEELVSERLLHVEERSSYSGIDVMIVDNQIVLKSAADDDRVEGWIVNSTQTEEIVSLPADAPDFDYTGPAGSTAGYKMYEIKSDDGPNPLEMICFSEDYDSTHAENGGALSCFRKGDVTAGHSLTDADAIFMAYYELDNAYAGTGVVAEDFDNDGKTDLLMGGGDPGVLTIDYDAFTAVKTATTFPVVRVYPTDADLGKAFTVCDIDDNGVTDGSPFCQAQLWVDNHNTLIVTDSFYLNMGTASLIESYDLSVWPPVQTGQLTVSTIQGDPSGSNVEYIPAYDLVGINQFGVDRWIFLDPITLWTEWTVEADSHCGAYGIEAAEVNSVPYLWLGCVELDGAETKSGEVYMFDISSSMPVRTSSVDLLITEGDVTYGGQDMDLGISIDGGEILAIGNESPGDVGSNNGMDVHKFSTEYICE